MNSKTKSGETGWERVRYVVSHLINTSISTKVAHSRQSRKSCVTLANSGMATAPVKNIVPLTRLKSVGINVPATNWR
jgi:hypothetical protein